MPGKSKIRSPEQKLRKMLKEERVIIDLELAIKKEQFRNIQKTTTESLSTSTSDLRDTQTWSDSFKYKKP